MRACRVCVFGGGEGDTWGNIIRAPPPALIALHVEQQHDGGDRRDRPDHQHDHTAPGVPGGAAVCAISVRKAQRPKHQEHEHQGCAADGAASHAEQVAADHDAHHPPIFCPSLFIGLHHPGRQRCPAGLAANSLASRPQRGGPASSWAAIACTAVRRGNVSARWSHPSERDDYTDCSHRTKHTRWPLPWPLIIRG